MLYHNRLKLFHVSVIILAAYLLSACGNEATPVPTMDMNEFSTAAVQTIEADRTATALAAPSDTPEPTATPLPVPTEVPESIVILPMNSAAAEPDMIVNRSIDSEKEKPNTVLPSVPDVPSVQVLPPTATIPAETSGDRASYQSQTPADNVHVGRGESFDITWFLLNTGTTTWTTDYCLRYFTGTNFTKPGKDRYFITEPVAPNSVGACTVDAIAPEEPGTYKMSAVLGNENDENFFIVDMTIIVD